MDTSRGGCVGEVSRQRLPAGLAEMGPGPRLSAVLALIDRSRVAAEDLRELVRARARQVAFDQAELLADVLDAGCSALAEPGSLARTPVPDEKYAADVVSWMLYVTPSYAQSRLHLAQALIERLPRVYAELRAGRLDEAKAAAFADSLSGLADDVARAVAAKLLDRAREWNLSQLRERLRYHVDRADKHAARRRYHTGVANRGVALRADDDGTASLPSWGLPPHRAAAAFDRVDRLARAAHKGGDPRTLGQLRADAYLDLLIGNPFQIIPTVDPLTAEADHACPLNPDDYVEDRGPVPPEWFHAARPEEAPDWWRAATRRRPWRALTPGQLLQRYDARASRPAGAAAAGSSPPVLRDCPQTSPNLDPDPAWWQRATTTRPEHPVAESGSPDSRLGTGNPDAVLPGDRCTCGRLLPTYHRGSVELQLKLSTLVGLDDDPGLIPGFGPVIADIARQVALDQQDPTWRFAIFGEGGALAHHGYTHRRPSGKHAAFVRARDRSCRTPNCRRKASRCEIDHRRPWSERGPSLPWNLDCRCGRHHDLKEQPGVTVTKVGNTTTITLPCGNSYPVRPDKDLILVAED